MRGQNRAVFIILIFLVIAAVFVYFDRFADCGRRMSVNRVKLCHGVI